MEGLDRTLRQNAKIPTRALSPLDSDLWPTQLRFISRCEQPRISQPPSDSLLTVTDTRSLQPTPLQLRICLTSIIDISDRPHALSASTLPMDSTQPVQSPVSTSRATATIDGVETQVVAQSFEDKVLVIVTQVGKVGQLVRTAVPFNPCELKADSRPP